MNWFTDFTALEWAYFIIACIGTVLLLVQVILMIVGAGDGGPDFDTDTDADGALDSHTDTGLSLFSVKGLTAFFAIGGWTGLVMLTSRVSAAISIPVSVVAGIAAYFIVWFAVRMMLKLQEDGTADYGSAVGKQATVYVSVPPARSGRGKVTLVLQGRYTEADAVTDDAERIPVDASVEIVGSAAISLSSEGRNRRKPPKKKNKDRRFSDKSERRGEKMSLVPARCPQCGGILEVDETQEAALCRYCGTPFITEKAIHQYITNVNTTVNQTTNINADTVHIHQDEINRFFVIEGGTLIRYNGKLRKIVIPEGVTAIGDNVFAETDFDEIVLPASVVEIGKAAFVRSTADSAKKSTERSLCRKAPD